MDNHLPESSSKPAQPPSASSAGCLPGGVLVFVAGIILFGVTVTQSIIWTIEQTLLQGSLTVPDVRWLIGLGFGLAIFGAAGIAWLVSRGRSEWGFARVLAFAGLYSGLLALARLAGITNALGTAAAQIGLSLLFLIIEGLISRRTMTGMGGRSLAAALLGGAVVGFPWVLWGALGSAWDTALNLLAALLFGWSASRILQPQFSRADGSRGFSTVLMDGFVAALALLVMVSGLASNGNQGLLALAVPVLGWAVASLPGPWHDPSTTARSSGSGFSIALLAGLAAFWPMAFVDPDELSVVFTGDPGDLIQWANQAAVLAALVGGGVSLAMLLLHRRLGERRGLVFAVAAAAAWLGLALVYLFVGQPGLFGERLFVILKDQADLTSAGQIQDPGERRAYVYRTLVDQADRTQAGIRQSLNNWRVAYQPYYLENALEVEGGPLLRWWLERRPEVDRVLDNPILRPLPEPVPVSTGENPAPTGVPWNLEMIGADRVWDEFGVTGQGIVVGQSDSGAQGSHPELADSYRGQGGQDDFNWYDPWYNSASPTDIGGHGTHTLGSILGNSVGVAPDAQWIGCVNLGRNLGSPALYLDCMQFMLAPFPQDGDPLHDGRPELGAHVINNSWGCPPAEGCDPNALLAAVGGLRAAGIFVAASAGNDGDMGCGSVKDPIALYDAAYSVGAVDRNSNLAPFSSQGPVMVDGSQRTKPDIVAPGVGVLSAYPGGTYYSASGTSMAGPHIAGVVALMWSANPDLIGNIDRTEQILNETAQTITVSLPECGSPGTPSNAVGYGLVDAYEAVKMALEIR